MITVLVSVFDKTGLTDFLTRLKTFDQLRIIATSSTAQFLRENNFECTNVETLTKFPEILGGRVKTLHPKVFGGILARDISEDEKSLAEFDIWKIDIVIVNLYPFLEKLKENLSETQMVEYIDIGGVSLIRAAAKNFKRVSIICQSDQYVQFADSLSDGKGKTSEDLRRTLAQAAFEHTAAYDHAIATYLLAKTEKDNGSSASLWPKSVNITLKQYQTLRYGENPHQAAAWCVDGLTAAGETVPSNIETSNFPPFTQLQGKELSANNITDTYCLVKILREISKPSACIIKHNNPCGVAVGKTVEEAFEKAYNTDAKSAFGGIYGFSASVNANLAQKIAEGFVEIVLATAYDKAALAIFQAKKNLRVLQVKESLLEPKDDQSWHWQDLEDFGWIVERDLEPPVRPDQFQLVTGSNGALDNRHAADVAFAWAVVKHLTSNAIFVAKDGCSLGFGIGQTSRIASVEIALSQAGNKAKGAVMASDAFFPAIDNIETATRPVSVLLFNLVAA